MQGSIRFLFDYVSPYSYLAATQIRATAHRHARPVEAVPVLFAAMLDAFGTRGPGEVPVKREYMFRDVLRIARTFGVTLTPPETHPFNPLTALRATACVSSMDARWNLVEALYRAAWVQGRRVDQPEVVSAVADETGLDGRALVIAAVTPEAKLTLRSATDEAIGAGVFGVPTILVDGEMFWGCDSLPHLDRFLAGEAGADADTLARFRALRPSAVRSGAR